MGDRWTLHIEDFGRIRRADITPAPLTLFVSVDNGKHFTEIFKLEAEEGEFSYPAIICKGNKLYISYTFLRKNIAYWKITLEQRTPENLA